MWKITTRGFTLQEVLILATMNLETTLTRAVKPETKIISDEGKATQELRRLC
jgi:hypothetical protein